jgi:hypothetical protein
MLNDPCTIFTANPDNTLRIQLDPVEQATVGEKIKSETWVNHGSRNILTKTILRLSLQMID